jgi:hypothetical protein
MLDEEGMKNWYGPDGKNRPDIFAQRNTASTFATLMERIAAGDPYILTFRPWISTSDDNTGLIPQWENSDVLMRKNNAIGTPYLTHLPSPDEVTRMQASEALNWFVNINNGFTPSPEVVQALIDRLKNTVFPVELLGAE